MTMIVRRLLHCPRRLLAGSSDGRSSCFAGVFEQRELARLPSGVRPPDSGQTGRQWVWPL